MRKSQLTQEIVRELLDYDYHTGVFMWKHRGIEWFDPDGWNGGGTRGALRAQCSWNGKFFGKRAFNTELTFETNSYLSGCLLGENHSAHRMAFMWMRGRWPTEIDHKDGNGLNNRWSNLREVTRSENQMNRARSRFHNGISLKFDHIGIKQLSNGNFQARITVRGNPLHIGTFGDYRDAVLARKEAERRYGFSERHGIVRVTGK